VRDFFTGQGCVPLTYFVYFKARKTQHSGERPADGKKLFSEVAPRKKYRIANPPKDCNAIKLSYSASFPTTVLTVSGSRVKARISAQSQPEASGTPKMDLFCDL